MVGGRIIEMQPMTILAGSYPGRMTDVVRLWVHNAPNDECAVYAELADVMPALGQEIWWQSGRIFFDDDTRSLRKVGYSFNPAGLFRSRELRRSVTTIPALGRLGDEL